MKNIETINLAPEVNTIEAANNRASLCLQNAYHLLNTISERGPSADSSDYNAIGYNEKSFSMVGEPFIKNGLAAVVLEQEGTHEVKLCVHSHVTTKYRRILIATDDLKFSLSDDMIMSENNWGDGSGSIFGEKGLKIFKSFLGIKDLIRKNEGLTEVIAGGKLEGSVEGSIEVIVEYTDGSNGKISPERLVRITERDLINIKKGLDYKNKS